MQQISLVSFNDHAINDGSSYSATLMNADALPAAVNTFLEIQGGDATDSEAFAREVRTPLVMVRIRNYAQREALGEQLKRWFKSGTRGRLVARFVDDEEEYFLNCACVNIIHEPGDAINWIAQLESGDSNWRAVTPDSESWSITGTGGTKSIDVDGGDETRLSVTLVSTTGGTIGFDFQNIYRLPAVAGVNWGVRPWCIALDSAALVTAGKLQADMDDYRILVGGVEVPRWISGANTSTTKIWFNAPIGRGESLPLRTAIASSGGIANMELQITAAVRASLKRLPEQGIVYHGTEWIRYNGKDEVNCRLLKTRRRQFGTTMQAHDVNDAFLYIPNLIVARYGNAAVGDPSAGDPNYDDKKPVFDLAQSDNTKWVYTNATLFQDASNPNRPGSWTPVLERLGDVSTTYRVKENVETGDPALGGKMGSFLRDGLPDVEVGRAGWQLFCSGGFSEITMTGRTYANTNRWTAQAGCQRSADGAIFFSVFHETIPPLNTWTDFTKSAVAVAAGSRYLFVGLQGKIARVLDAVAMLEVLTGEVKFTSANLPSGAFLGETGNFSLDLTITNTRTGDMVMLNYPMKLETEFVLDGEARTVTYDEAPMSDAMRLDDEGRSVWIRLEPGTNEIVASSPDAGTISATLRWYRRRL